VNEELHALAVASLAAAVDRCRVAWKDAHRREPVAAELRSALRAVFYGECVELFVPDTPLPPRPDLTGANLGGGPLSETPGAGTIVRWTSDAICEVIWRPKTSKSVADLTIRFERDGDTLVADLDDLPGVKPSALDALLRDRVLPEASRRWSPVTRVRLFFGGTYRGPETWPAPAPSAPAIEPAAATRPLAIGATVTHKTFGRGRVTGITGTGPIAQVDVAFELTGSKRLQAKFLAPG
jgi:hypothetical protein